MKLKKNTYAVSMLLALLFATACFSQSKARVSVLDTDAPLFKRMAFNPAMRIRVYVPPAREINCRGIRVQLDKEAVKAIARLDVLMRSDGEPAFIPGAGVIASAKPASGLMTIPVDLSLKPGLNYVWISAVLNDEADIDKKIMLRVTGLIGADGNEYNAVPAVSPSAGYASSYKRLGIALRKPWDDSVHTYRIPGIVTTGKGTLIAVYDVRYKNSRDLPGNIDVGMSRSTDGGRTWAPMKIIMDMGAPHDNNGVGDPSVLFDPVTKKLWVAALWSKGNRSIAGSQPGLSPDTSGQFVLASSDDDGLTWSAPCNITAQVKNTAWHICFDGPGAGIAMQNGTLVFPSQYWDEKKLPHSSIVYSGDHGKSWKSGTGAKSNTTESQVLETTTGTLMLNMRDNRGRFRSVATTSDLGKTWTEHPTSYQALPDPVCMAAIIKAGVNIKGKMRDVLFFSNVATQTARQNTTIKASLDMGETWPDKDQLLLDSRSTFGYSSLTKIDDNTIGLLYEGEGELYFLRIPVSDIIK
jgi:sialidase-1